MAKTEINILTSNHIYPTNWDFTDYSNGVYNGWTYNTAYWASGITQTTPNPIQSIKHITGNTGTLTQDISDIEIGVYYQVVITHLNYVWETGINASTPIEVKLGTQVLTQKSFGTLKIYEGVANGTLLTITPISTTIFSPRTVRINKYNRAISNTLDLYADETLNINLQVNDIRDITKRNSTYSKTIKIPASKNNNSIFNNQFDIDVASTLGDYYLYKPIKAEIVYDSVTIRNGYIKLTNITRNDRIPIEYEIQFYSELATLASTLGDTLIFGNEDPINDIDVSDANHNFDFTRMRYSWLSGDTLSGNYIYPMIDYDGGKQSNIFTLEYLKPALFAKDLLDRIFEWAGYTYESGFLNSTFFKRLIVPWTGEQVVGDYEWLNAARRIDVYQSTNGGTVSTNYFLMPFNTEVSDFGGQWNGTQFYCNNAGNYDITCQITWRVVNTSALNTYVIAEITLNGDVIQTSNAILAPALNISSGITFISKTLDLNVGNIIKITLKSYQINLQGTLTTGCDYIGGSGNTYLKISLNKSSNMQAFVGDYIDMSKIFGGVQYKKIDFLTDIIKTFNLIVDEDPLKYNNLIIEPYDTYYSGGTFRDWTDKVEGSLMEITKLEEYVNKSILLTGKEDTDAKSVDYKSATNKTYGSKFYKNELEINKEQLKIETFYSPTILGYYGNGNNNIIVSKIYELNDDGTRVSRDFNPRLLYYNPLYFNSPRAGSTPFNQINIRPIESTNNWYLNSGTTTTYTRFPYAGHLDNPYYDDIDINFGACDIYYFNVVSNQYPPQITYKNLYWNYYRRSLGELLDRDSKLVKCEIKLSSGDLNSFRFCDTIAIGGTNYIVNKIIDWNPNQLCKIELLKLNSNYLKSGKVAGKIDYAIGKNISKTRGSVYDKPDASIPYITDLSGNTIQEEDDSRTLPLINQNTNKKTDNSNSILVGKYISIGNSTNTSIYGDYITIPSGSDNIMVVGRNITIQE